MATENTQTSTQPVKAEGSRTGILLRLLYTLLFLVVFEVLRFIVQLIVLVQYVLLLVTTKPNEKLRSFSNKVSVYAYRVLRYVTLNENARPYPFAEFPGDMDPPDQEVNFEQSPKVK